MTPQQQADKLNLLVANFQKIVSDSMEGATINLEADIRTRVFDENLDINGGGFGQYSSTPAYFGKKQFAVQGAFKGQGKNPEIVKEKPPKTMYLKGGYKELREIQNRPTESIDLQYTYDLFLNGIGTDFNGGYKVVFKNDLSQNKGRGFEDRKGLKIFYPSKEESEKAISFIKTHILDGIKQVFSV